MSVARGTGCRRDKDAGHRGRGIQARGVCVSEEASGTSKGRQRRERTFWVIPFVASSRTGDTHLRGQMSDGELGVSRVLTRAAVTRVYAPADIRRAAHLSRVCFCCRWFHPPACPPRLGLADWFIARSPRPPACELGEKASIRALRTRHPRPPGRSGSSGEPEQGRLQGARGTWAKDAGQGLGDVSGSPRGSSEIREDQGAVPRWAVEGPVLRAGRTVRPGGQG